MIKKIIERIKHYSITNAPSVYDEEAMTALELAGRTAAKVNQVVDSQNILIEETDKKLTEQDGRLDDQDKQLNRFERETIPAEARKAVDKSIADGSFDEAIDKYAGQLTDRLDNIITGQNGIVNDAEVIDARTGFDGTPYDNAGNAIRGQIGGIYNFFNKAKLKYTESLKAIEGSYITAAGEVIANTSFAYSEPVRVRAGYTITFKAQGYGTTVAMISKYIGGEYLALVTSRSGDTETYTYTVEETCDVVFCWSHKWGYTLDISVDFESASSGMVEDTKRDLAADFSPEFTRVVEGSYYNNAGELIENEGYSVGYLTVPAGYTLEFTAKGYKTQVAMIKSNTEIIPSTDSNMNTYRLTVDRDTECALSWSTSRGYSVRLKTTLSQISSLLNSPLNEIEDIPLSLFRTVGVVGDSYASGELWHNGASELRDIYSVSWLQVLARKHGFKGYNFSAGGYTTRTWLTLDKGLPLLEASEPCDLYILALGINDANAYGEEYIGSTMNINTDTYIGNYCRIINAIKAHAPNAKIIISTQASNEGVKKEYNEAVKTIAALYGIPYIVQLDDPFFTSELYTNKSHGHPTAIGYAGMANALERLIKESIIKHVDYFIDLYTYEKNEDSGESDEPSDSFNANYYVSGSSAEMTHEIKGQWDLDSIDFNNSWSTQTTTTEQVPVTIYALGTDGTVYDGVSAYFEGYSGYFALKLTEDNKVLYMSSMIDTKDVLVDNIISFGEEWQQINENALCYQAIVNYGTRVTVS